MFDIIIDKLKIVFSSRMFYMVLAVVIMFSLLVGRVYSLQILNTESAAEASTAAASSYKSSQMRYNDSTRGNIYDVNGNLLAYNVQSYNIVMSNSAVLTKNAARNSMIYKLLGIIEAHGYEPELDFPITVNAAGELAFKVSGTAELRFKKNAYGLTSITKLTDAQRAATAQEVFDFMRYGDDISAMFGISDEYSLEDALKIMAVRYELFTLYPQYSQFTLCSDVDDQTIAAIVENSPDLPGVEVKQVTSRVYNDSIYFAHILGYIGAANEDEAELLNRNYETARYNTSDMIGKTGIEKEMDLILRGEKGEEQLAVNSAGKIVSSKEISSPIAGNDIYLTIDREVQIACYHILENNIAAILISKIVDSMDYGAKGVNAQKMTIPIYEVYDSLFSNYILNIDHFKTEDASPLETEVYRMFLGRKELTLRELEKVLDYNAPIVNSALSEDLEGYVDYIYSMLKSEGVVVKNLVDTKDEVYKRYADDQASLTELLVHAIDMQWIDLSKLGIGSSYYTNAEIYDDILQYIYAELDDDSTFERMLYRSLIFSFELTGRQVCMLLFDQEVIKYNEDDYQKLSDGTTSPYSFIISKLETLELTPGMLALEPCSGSIVITDVNTGQIRALVSYPSYDNNLLTNKIDWDYYQSLLNNKSTPLMARATQQLLSTGSTIKPLIALAGLGEGVITTRTKIFDEYVFELITPSPKCLRAHGTLNVTQAIQYSCNYFFYQVGYWMALDVHGDYSDSLGIAKIQKYASMFGLNTKSGLEVPEAMPSISSTDAVRSSIGYYHLFTPAEISRYITGVANKGTIYNLTLVDKIADKEQNNIVYNKATVYNKIDMYSDEEWDAVQQGMNDVVNTSANGLNTMFGDLGFLVAGKTGTAQVSLTHPSHTLFLSFAPYEKPDISVTIVVPNGYKSANPAKICRDVYGLYYNDENKEALLNGTLTTTSVTSVNVAD